MADKPWKAPTAIEVKERWKLITDDMLDTRRNFLLNTSFFHGDQWVRWDDNLATVNITQFLSDQEGEARSTVNKLKPRMTSLLARLCGQPLTFQTRPEGVDAYAIQKAQLADAVLEVKAHRDGWSKVRRREVNYALLGGVSAICDEPAFQYDDAPIFDTETGDEIKVPSRPAPKLTALSAVEFGLEPGTVDECDALWWIRNTTLTPTQVKRRYKLDWTPQTDSEAAAGAMQRALRSNRRGSTPIKATMVLVYYERPTDESPGIVLHVVNDRIVEQTDWPFPYKDLNITTFTETEIGGTWKGDTRMNDARQLQMQINKAYTSIAANIGRTDNNRMLVPAGSVMDSESNFTGTPGETIEYNAEIGTPHWMEVPDVAARGLRDHIEKLEGELDDLFSTPPVSRGVAPGDRNSGLALSILTEQAQAPMGLIAEDQQRGWQRIAEHVLQMERHLMTMVEAATGQPMQVTDVLMHDNGGEKEPKEVSWTADDLSEYPVVMVPLDAVMPHSQAATQDMMMKLAANPAFATMFQQLSAHQLGVILSVPNPGAFARVADAHVEEANWENAMMANGADETVVKVAAWQPHEVHIASHNSFRATAGYRNADPDVQKFVDLHIQAHETLFAQDQQQHMMEQAQQQQAAMMGQGPPPGPPGSPPPPGP